ncbi:MAG: signal peptidase I [Oscillospiraceae bacterium]|nr:signal peptidase I [Oscillospiraceae bacterium]
MNKTKPVKKTNFLDEFLDWLKSLAITFIFVVLIFTFVCRTAVVSGDSMSNTLHDKDFLILWSLFYQPKNGDIISANCEGLNEVIVKRVIACEGQTVDIDFSTGSVYVDGVLLDEPYIKNLTINDEFGFDYPITVPEGKYFVMGDNRQGSRDSRHPAVKFVDREDILGKVVLRVFPFEKFGTVE